MPKIQQLTYSAQLLCDTDSEQKPYSTGRKASAPDAMEHILEELRIKRMRTAGRKITLTAWDSMTPVSKSTYSILMAKAIMQDDPGMFERGSMLDRAAAAKI